MAKRNLTGRQLAFLFAIGALRRSGGGGKKGEKLTYHPEKLREYKRMSGKGSASSTYRQKGSTFIGGRDSQTAKGFASRHNHNTNGAKYDPSISKSGLGMKSAHLRGSGGSSGGRKLHPRAEAYLAKPKAEREAIRGQGIAAGLDRLGVFAGQKAATLRRINPRKDLKEITAKYPGRFYDTKRPFEAGEKVYYGHRAGTMGPKTFRRPGNKSVGELKFENPANKSQRTARVAVVVANRFRQFSEGATYGAGNRTQMNAALSDLQRRTGGTRRQLFGLAFRDAYRGMERPRWRKKP